jgi:hypothetical protein
MGGADELRDRGYEFHDGDGWRLVNPEARPRNLRNPCPHCRKYEAQPDWGMCAGCAWFGPGDPHGLRRQSPEVPDQPDLPPGTARAQALEQIVSEAVSDG